MESNGSHLSSPHGGGGGSAGYNAAATDHREGKPDEEWHALDTLEKAKVCMIPLEYAACHCQISERKHYCERWMCRKSAYVKHGKDCSWRIRVPQ